MVRRNFGLWLLVVVWLGGCGGDGALKKSEPPGVGLGEADLVAKAGQPQKILPGPDGGKIFVYTRYNLDQVAAMGGGAWSKPDQMYYHLDARGIVTRVNHYPYGKRKFILPSEEQPAQVAGAAPPQQAAPPPAVPPAAPLVVSSPAAPVTPPPAAEKPSAPAKLRTAAGPAAAAPAAAPLPGGEAATRLELNMTREEVRRVLGVPERTEGFRVGGKAVIVWFYLLEDRQGRRGATPLVFENSRLSGWGETHYRRLLREAGQP